MGRVHHLRRGMDMKPSRFTEEQIIGILREQEAGAKSADVCRKHGISSATFYKWKAKYGGLEASDAKRLKALEDENAKRSVPPHHPPSSATRTARAPDAWHRATVRSRRAAALSSESRHARGTRRRRQRTDRDRDFPAQAKTNLA